MATTKNEKTNTQGPVRARKSVAMVILATLYAGPRRSVTYRDLHDRIEGRGPRHAPLPRWWFKTIELLARAGYVVARYPVPSVEALEPNAFTVAITGRGRASVRPLIEVMTEAVGGSRRRGK